MVAGSNQVCADVVLEILGHPAFANIVRMITKPLEEKIEQQEKIIEQLKSKVNTLEIASKSLKEKTEQNIENITKQNNRSAENETTDEERAMNLIVHGLEENQNEDIQKVITQLIEARFKKSGVKFECTRIGIKRGTTSDEQKPRAVKVRFFSIWDRREIYYNRVSALAQTGIYINEDLAPDNAHLAYQARELKRNKTIHQTWTQMGRVYIREKPNSAPVEFTKTTKTNSEDNETTENLPLVSTSDTTLTRINVRKLNNEKTTKQQQPTQQKQDIMKITRQTFKKNS